MSSEDNTIEGARMLRELFAGIEKRTCERQHGEAFKGLDLPRRCDHEWVTTSNWLIDRCTKCGEERA